MTYRIETDTLGEVRNPWREALGGSKPEITGEF